MLVCKFVVPKKLPLCNPDNKITELFSICDDVSKVFDNTFGYAAAIRRLSRGYRVMRLLRCGYSAASLRFLLFRNIKWPRITQITQITRIEFLFQLTNIAKYRKSLLEVYRYLFNIYKSWFSVLLCWLHHRFHHTWILNKESRYRSFFRLHTAQKF